MRGSSLTRHAPSRGDADDPALFFLHHMARDSLRAEKDSFKIDSQNAVPVLLRHVDDGNTRNNSCAVKQIIDLAETAQRGFNHAVDAGFVSDIDAERNGDALFFRDPVCQGFSRVYVEIRDHDLKSVARQAAANL